MLQNFRKPATGFFRRGAKILAPDLIGCLLRKKTDDGFISGIIVETEAYTQDDPASHSFRGRSARNSPMFEMGGLAYVYLIYGVHNCFNITSGMPGNGEAVLIRALQPIDGIDLMIRNRGTQELRDLCSGPGKLCQALQIDRQCNGISLRNSDIQLFVPNSGRSSEVSVTRRIGITLAADLERRYILTGSKYISKKI